MEALRGYDHSVLQFLHGKTLPLNTTKVESINTEFKQHLNLIDWVLCEQGFVDASVLHDDFPK